MDKLYPFGHALSYTTFDYSNLKLNADKIKSQAEIKVAVTFKNTGSRKGDEIVQLYIKDKVSSVISYDSQLRGFERVTLNPGESKTIEFVIKPQDQVLLDKNMNWTVEPGEFEVWIGSSSADIKLKKSFVVE